MTESYWAHFLPAVSKQPCEPLGAANDIASIRDNLTTRCLAWRRGIHGRFFGLLELKDHGQNAGDY